jgi:beta-phosphoglucomutase-like phosphatase (HAD superfamily)
VKALPGARRLALHLAKHNIPIAVATSTSRSSYNIKMQNHADVRQCVGAVVCGDEIENGKPAPDTFLKAAGLLNVAPAQCIVFEDSPSGIQVRPLHVCTCVAFRASRCILRQESSSSRNLNSRCGGGVCPHGLLVFHLICRALQYIFCAQALTQAHCS